MCCVSTTDEVTAGALPAPLLELIDAKVPNERRARQGVRIGLHEEADAARRLRAVARGALRRDLDAFELADARRADEFAVRVFEPSPPRTATKRRARWSRSAPRIPFLYDSVAEELDAWGLDARRVIHPVIGVERGSEGRIVRVLHVRQTEDRESLMHFELEQRLTEQERTELERAIRGILGDVRLAVRDFEPMKEAARA